MTENWQKQSLEHMCNILKGLPETSTIILKGSLAMDTKIADKWSDIDLLVILENDSLDKYYSSLSWIQQMGKIFAIQKFKSEESATLRICFDDFSRFDIVLAEKLHIREISFGSRIKVLYSDIADIEEIILNQPKNDKFQVPTKTQFEEMANNLWFLAISAVSKIIRGDYLVGSHLALEMAQNCVVLQMMIRDKRKGTTVHRTGDCEYVQIISNSGYLESLQMPVNILKLIDRSGFEFDRLAKEYSEDYIGKYEKLTEWLKEAEKAILGDK